MNYSGGPFIGPEVCFCMYFSSFISVLFFFLNTLLAHFMFLYMLTLQSVVDFVYIFKGISHSKPHDNAEINMQSSVGCNVITPS